jgi:hypothetical protein
MGFEPMLRVLQFCTVDLVIVKRFQRSTAPSSECSCTASPLEKPEKFSKNGPPLETSKPFLKLLTEIRSKGK